MKLFIDTNIFLDLLLNREHASAAKTILELIQQEIHDAVVADISILNIDYVAKKQTANIRDFLEFINSTFTITGAENQHFAQALKNNNTDLEDNIQSILAQQAGCEIIITNDKNFPSSQLKTVTSTEFIALYF